MAMHMVIRWPSRAVPAIDHRAEHWPWRLIDFDVIRDRSDTPVNAGPGLHTAQTFDTAAANIKIAGVLQEVGRGGHAHAQPESLSSLHARAAARPSRTQPFPFLPDRS